MQTASLTQQADAQAAAADAAAKKSAEEAARIAGRQGRQGEEEGRGQARPRPRRKEAERRGASRSAVRDAVQLLRRRAPTPSPRSRRWPGRWSPADQFQCFSNIVNHESSWNYRATNPSSGAYGLVQALPGSKMASAGADWQTNPATQIKWGLNYMNSRYGSPCGAWSFWQANHWY